MKKVALLFVAILFATVTFAQTNMPIDPKTEKICFRRVINTVGSEDEVFNRIYSGFMNSYYKSPSTILQQNDGRTMKGKHQMQLDNGPREVGMALDHLPFHHRGARRSRALHPHRLHAENPKQPSLRGMDEQGRPELSARLGQLFGTNGRLCGRLGSKV